jgi:phospholipid/cholesterol/gamma-HCH transport system substrate-binding protein
MKEIQNTRAIIVGIFLFFGLIFLAGGIFMVGSLRDAFNKKIQITSLFDDVKGLDKGNNITFLGVKIGIVKDLKFYGKKRVVVILNVDKKTQKYIRKDAKVKIISDGLVGNKMLVIYGGSENAAQIKDGDVLMPEKTLSTEDMMNMLQENNKNLLVVTTDLKTISGKLIAGEGTIGMLLNDKAVYNNINAATASLHLTALRAGQIANSLAEFSAGLKKKGSLANELVNDTTVFISVKASVLQLQQVANKANAMVVDLKNATNNPKTTMGVLIHDEDAGNRLKAMIKNLESSSIKLDDDLEAVQHNFLLRGFFKKKAKNAKRDSTVLK